VRGATDFYLVLQGWILKFTVGITYSVEGYENLPEAPYLIASQHESTWETLYFHMLLDAPVMYAKENIFSMPVFGPLARKMGHLPIERAVSSDKIRDRFRRGADVIAQGRSLLIFPTGTRRHGGSEKLQTGVGVVYQLCQRPVVPVLLDSGRCWPHLTWLKYPGHITVRILPPIPAGMDRRALMTELDHILLPQAPAKAD